MFTDILTKKELDNIHQIYSAEGETPFFKRLAFVYEKIILRNDETNLDLARETTVLNIFKLNKQNKKLNKGLTEITEFYNRFNDKFRIGKKDYYKNTTSDLINSLTKEIRKIKERITAILQLYASWGSTILAIIAIIISIVAINI